MVLTAVDMIIVKSAMSRIAKRAERNSEGALKDTFVELSDLSNRFSSNENQILFGRRGTGKTHALIHLHQSIKEEGLAAIMLDLRTTGSAGGYYLSNPGGRSLAALRIIVDILGDIHNRLFEISLNLMDEGEEVTQLVKGMDRLAEAASALTIDGHVTEGNEYGESRESSSNLKGGISTSSPFMSGSASQTDSTSVAQSRSVEGRERPTLNFGDVAKAISQIVPQLPGQELWILIDEWSAVPLDVQPILADFFRRCIFPCKGTVVKIAAVERRSKFWMPDGRGYIGLELGSDIFTGLDLDDYIGNNLKGTHIDTGFYHELVWRHIKFGVRQPAWGMWSLREVVPDFDAAVHFAGGIPRDLLSICGLAASRGSAEWVTFEDIARAARTLFVQEKEAQARWTTRSRALSTALREFAQSGNLRFMADRDHESLNGDLLDLLDERMVHLLDRAVGPGGRYDVFAVDMGIIADILAEDHHLKKTANPWLNWDHVKTSRKFAPLLKLGGNRIQWGEAT